MTATITARELQLERSLRFFQINALKRLVVPVFVSANDLLKLYNRACFFMAREDSTKNPQNAGAVKL